MSNETAITKADPRVADLKALFERAKPALANVVPKHLTPDRLVRVAVASISRTPALLNCSQTSLLQAVMQAAELGLEPGSALGEAYLVPYKGTVVMIPGYRGLIALARRSGQIEDIEAHVVYAADKFLHRKGTSACLDHEPSLAVERGEIIAVYAMGWVKGSARPHVEVMTKAEIDAVRARSASGGAGPWKDHYSEMARKTVVKRLVKYLPLSVELAQALTIDDEQFAVGDKTGADVIDVSHAPQKSLKEKARAAKEKATARPGEPPDDEPLPTWATGDADVSDRVPGQEG